MWNLRSVSQTSVLTIERLTHATLFRSQRRKQWQNLPTDTGFGIASKNNEIASFLVKTIFYASTKLHLFFD